MLDLFSLNIIVPVGQIGQALVVVRSVFVSTLLQQMAILLVTKATSGLYPHLQLPLLKELGNFASCISLRP